MSFRIFGPVMLCVIATVIGTLFVSMSTQSTYAGVACALVGLFATALMYDGAAHGEIRPADAAPSPAPASLFEEPPLLGQPEIDALVEALPQPAFIVSDGRIARANRATLTLLGHHVLGQDVRLAIRHPAVTQHLVGDHAGQAATMELVGIGIGDQSWEIRITPLSPTRQLVLLTDQSARRAAEKMRVDFVANASHELRTPLAGILGFIETLNDRDAGNDIATRERFLSIMEGEARRMQRLVDDLMSLSRIEAEKFRQPEQHVDLCALVQETADVLAKGSNLRAQDIALDLDLGCPPIRGDQAQLSQLIHNLVSNALKYGRAGTPVVVTLLRDGPDMIRLTVADEGDGIAPEHLPRLTERFYRVDASRSKAAGGTGLGLAIVKHIVERHRGRLQIDSVVGRGTTMGVMLPIPAAPAA
ncbi:ATP-binding protein [Sphingobium sufflavum]|uniref:ATP-binding protein n=1 Tax=Sphingobium sufflavum TaxID=1129547 RepID=UPI001F1E9B91|nr:ATP-binding protein [Sphingobium sufflavum]MCE7795818.1 ATP-binding protein [Sphingobium sufflavum]